MSAERDAGLAALQRGDSAAAIEQLERAHQNEPGDFQALTFLGAAYGQADRHNDAVTALTSAVNLQPSSAQARYNLAVALKNGGWAEQALAAAQQAIQLQPNYDKAMELIQRLQPEATQQIQPPPIPNYQATDPTVYNQPSAAPTYAQPTYQNPAPGYGQPQQPYSPPPEPQQAGLAGGQSYSSMGSQGAAAYGGPPRPSQASQPPLVFNHLPGDDYEDSFNPLTALKDWGRALVQPGRLFRDQVNRQGLKSPMALLFVYVLISSIVLFIKGKLGGTSALVGDITVVAFIVTQLSVIIGLVLISLISAGIANLVSGWFGGSGSFSQTYRVWVYSYAPYAAIMLFLGLVGATPVRHIAMAEPATRIVVTQAQFQPNGRQSLGTFRRPLTGYGQGYNGSPGYPGSSTGGVPGSATANPGFAALMGMFSNPLLLIGLPVAFFWCAGLFIFGISTVHQVSGGTAFGISIVAGILDIVVLVGLSILVSIVGVGAMMASMSGRH